MYFEITKTDNPEFIDEIEISSFEELVNFIEKNKYKHIILSLESVTGYENNYIEIVD